MHLTLAKSGFKITKQAHKSLAEGIVGAAYGITAQHIRESFVGEEKLHRLQQVGIYGGIEFINDSASTTVNATWYALEEMAKPVVLIAGGVNKDNDYQSLHDLMRRKVKVLICLGTDNSHMHHELSKMVPIIINTQSMAEAVGFAKHMASAGDVVLLSPACASFDLFESYRDRGNQFTKAVLKSV